MILIGTMNLTRTRDTGTFYCPGCGTNCTYRYRTRRPFLTLYFIPTIPVGAAEPFVQCDRCRASWDVGVLEMTRESHESSQREQFREDALRATVLITTADGTISEAEIAAIHQVSEHLLQRSIDREELGALCASARRLGIPPVNFIRTVKANWNQEQRTTIVKAAFLACSAEGDLNPEQLQILGQLKEMFDMTDREYEMAIEEALAISLN
jgi:uncharacterized tellurite resistance protein B-like protein